MFSKRMNHLAPYVPGEQPQDKTYIKLNTNENAYPPSQGVKKVLEEADPKELRLYPDPKAGKLRSVIGESFGLSSDWVFVGNGSDEVLSFCFYAFFDSDNGNLLFPEHTYSFYPVYCDFYSVAYTRIPLMENFSVDTGAFLNSGPFCGIIFPNPNAPTGIALSLSDITDLMDRTPSDKVVIIDEAYVNFGAESAVSIIPKYPNLLVVRTFSKYRSLAGIRLGYAIGNPPLIKALFTVKDSFNSYPLGRLTQEIGEIAFLQNQYYQKTAAVIVETRTFFTEKARLSGWEVLPSKANFVFARKKGYSGMEIYTKLKEAGFLVRHFNSPGISDFVRITIGTRDNMEALLKTLETVLP